MTTSPLSFPFSFSFIVWWPSSSASAPLPKDRGEANSEAAIKRPCLVYLFSAEITSGVLQIFLSSVPTPLTVIQMMRVKYPPQPLSPTIFKTGPVKQGQHVDLFCIVWASSRRVFSKTQELLDMIYVTSCQKANDKSLGFIQNTLEIKCSPFWCHLHSHLSCIVERREGSRALSVV